MNRAVLLDAAFTSVNLTSDDYYTPSGDQTVAVFCAATQAGKLRVYYLDPAGTPQKVGEDVAIAAGGMNTFAAPYNLPRLRCVFDPDGSDLGHVTIEVVSA